MKKVLIIQNDVAEGAGLLGSLLEDQRFAVDTANGTSPSGSVSS